MKTISSGKVSLKYNINNNKYNNYNNNYNYYNSHSNNNKKKKT